MRRRAVPSVALAAAVCLAVAVPAFAQGVADTRQNSPATVVVAKPDASPIVKVVGTSTITVAGGATVQQVEAQLVATDRSKQSYDVVDASGHDVSRGPVHGGDQLVVTSADGRHTYTYQLAIFDPDAQARDGAYWNESRYDRIDSTVNAHTPTFPDRQCDITDPKYAGLLRQVTDGAGSSPQLEVWYYGDAINAAIADCSAAGGGTVVVPAGGARSGDATYYSGAITLLSHVNLHIEAGATIKFVRNPTNDFYPVVLTSREGTDLYNYSPLVYALNQTDIAITGGGTLDAQDNVSHWQLPAGLPGAPIGTNTVLNDMNYEDVPIEKRIFSDDGHLPATIPVVHGDTVRNVAPPADAVAYKSTFTPNFIEFNHSANILVEDVNVRNTIFWQIHPLNSRNVLVRDMDVSDTAHHTDDGIDPESCDNVVIERNHVTVLDDAVAVKSGRNLDGRKYRQPSQNIIIRDNVFYNPNGGSASISTGSEMSGGIRNIFAEHNQSGGAGTAYLLKIKMNAYRGGAVQDVYVRDSLVTQTIRGIVNFDSNYSESVPFPNADVFNPTIRNIYLDNVDAAPTVSTKYPAFVISSNVSRSPIEGVHYRNSTFYTTASFESAFSSTSSRFFHDLEIDNVRFVNPVTQTVTDYNASSPALLDATTADVGGTSVSLQPANPDRPDAVNGVPSSSFRLRGRIDLAHSPGFLPGGTVQVFVDRNTTPVPVTLDPDGTFVSDVIQLNDNQYWYVDRHYVAVNFYHGLDMNTVVYPVAVAG
jgi:hypothetical protein